MTRRAYLYFILTFVLGIIVGGAGTIFYEWHWGHWHRGFDKQRIVRHLKRELNLSDTQVQQVDQLMDDWMKKYEALRGQVNPQFDALREERRNRIRQVLNPEQLAKFNELVRRNDERMKRERAH